MSCVSSRLQSFGKLRLAWNAPVSCQFVDETGEDPSQLRQEIVLTDSGLVSHLADVLRPECLAKILRFHRRILTGADPRFDCVAEPGGLQLREQSTKAAKVCAIRRRGRIGLGARACCCDGEV